MHELVAIELSPLVGRERELAALHPALDQARVVTLTGPGGVGKTRLALAVVAARREPVTAVELAAVQAPEHVPEAVLSALGVRSERDVEPWAAVAAWIGDGCRLLLLDNCEHLCAAAGDLVAPLLLRCSSLRVLATSREPLGVPGEVVFVTPPLPRPDATALFLDRARRVRRDYSPDSDQLTAIGCLCDDLDGLPLAIELAAARVRILGLAELAEPDRRLDLLAGGRRDVPRHQSLRASIDWSCSLLDDHQRALFRRLSVFAGGWQFDAAEAVCAGGPLRQNAVLDAIASLADRSLVTVERRDGLDRRFGMLATVREYAAEQLRLEREEDRVQARHAAWFTAVAERAEAALMGAGQIRALAELDRETANIRAALAWASTADPGLGLRIASSLALFWTVRGRLTEGRTTLERLLADAPAHAAELRARSLWALGLLQVGLGELDAARPVVDEALSRARSLDDRRLLGRALNLMARLDLIRDPVAAAEPLERAIELAQTAADSWCLADSLGKLGATLVYQGDAHAARDPLTRALTLARAAGEQSASHRALGGLARVALLDGRHEEAARLLGEGLEISRALGDRNWIAIDLAMLGEVQRAGGRLTESRALIEEALGLARDVDAGYPIYLATGLLGRVALAEGASAEARELFTAATARGREHGYRPYAAWWPLGLAQLAASEGDVAAARHHYQHALDAADALRNRRDVAAATTGLGRLASRAGEHEIAIAQLADALAWQSEFDDHIAAAETLDALLPALRAAGQSERADRIAAARTQRGLAHAIALALRGRGSRSRDPERGRGGLTRAEAEVAELAAQGHNNPDIAQRLFMSRSTVKAHLSHVYAKLGVTNRTELAATFRDREL